MCLQSGSFWSPEPKHWHWSTRPARTQQLHHRIGKAHKHEIRSNIKNNQSVTYILDKTILNPSPECCRHCTHIQGNSNTPTHAHDLLSSKEFLLFNVKQNNCPSNCIWCTTSPCIKKLGSDYQSNCKKAAVVKCLSGPFGNKCPAFISKQLWIPCLQTRSTCVLRLLWLSPPDASLTCPLGTAGESVKNFSSLSR